MSSINRSTLVQKWHTHKRIQTAGKALLYVVLVLLSWVCVAVFLWESFLIYDIVRSLYIAWTTDVYETVNAGQYIGAIAEVQVALALTITGIIFVVVLSNRIFARRFRYTLWHWYPVVPFYRWKFEKLGEWVAGYRYDNDPVVDNTSITREKYIARRRIRMN